MTNYSLDSYDFKALAKKAREKRIYQRLMMLAYLKEGMSKAQVSRLTFTAPDRVYAWLRRFREQGIEGLRDKPRSGRPGLLDRSAYDALRQKIEDSQSSLSGVVFEEKILFSWLRMNGESSIHSAVFIA